MQPCSRAATGDTPGPSEPPPPPPEEEEICLICHCEIEADDTLTWTHECNPDNPETNAKFHYACIAMYVSKTEGQHKSQLAHDHGKYITYNQGCPKCRKPFARQAVKRKARRELRSAGVQGWDLGA